MTEALPDTAVPSGGGTRTYLHEAGGTLSQKAAADSISRLTVCELMKIVWWLRRPVLEPPPRQSWDPEADPGPVLPRLKRTLIPGGAHRSWMLEARQTEERQVGLDHCAPGLRLADDHSR